MKKNLILFAAMSFLLFACQNDNSRTAKLDETPSSTLPTTLQPAAEEVATESESLTLLQEEKEALSLVQQTKKTQKQNSLSQKNTWKADYSTLNRFFDSIPKPLTDFVFDNENDTVLICTQGTRLHIPANAFIDENGNEVLGEVNFKVLEYYKMSDILLGNLTTLSDDKIIETNGMLHLSAYTQEGLSCKLKANKAIDIEMPTYNMREDMLFFDGQRNADSVMNWTPVGTNANINKYKIYKPYEVDERAEFAEDWVDRRVIFGGLMQEKFKSAKEGLLIGCVVSPDGTIVSASVILGKSAQNDYMNMPQLIDQLPAVKPAIKDGKAVNSYFLMPIAVDAKNDGFYYAKNYRHSNDYKVPFEKLIPNPYTASLQYYLFSAMSLGWKNCDAFINSEEFIEDVLVDIPEDYLPYTKLYLVPRSINGIISANFIKNTLGFPRIPKGEEVNVIAVYMKGNNIRFGKTNLFINSNTEKISIDFKLVEDQEQLSKYLAKAGAF